MHLSPRFEDEPLFYSDAIFCRTTFWECTELHSDGYKLSNKYVQELVNPVDTVLMPHYDIIDEELKFLSGIDRDIWWRP